LSIRATARRRGPRVGQTETDTIASHRIADGVYSISWVEIDGFVVSKVVDFNAGTDYSFWSFEVPGKRASTAQSAPRTRIWQQHIGAIRLVS
jgi:hypothetical protein